MRCFIPVIAGIALAFFVAVSKVVWLPDMLFRKEVVVSRLAIRDGEFVDLTQRWGGDGYATGIRHRLRSGEVWNAQGDPDMSKAWRARMVLQTNSASVRILVNQQEWRYFYTLRSLSIDGRWVAATPASACNR